MNTTHTISVFVENHSGALSSIAGLFSSRGYNITSLTVAETDDPTIARMTIVVTGDESVLDFGCGGGVGSRCLSKFLNGQGHLTCVDISSFWIEKAAERLKKHPSVECKSGDIRELDIPEVAFDVISIFHVIHDIAPAERQSIVNALSRKLKANGALFIREPVKKSHGMPVEEIRTLLSNASLKEIEFKETKSEYMGKHQKSV